MRVAYRKSFSALNDLLLAPGTFFTMIFFLTFLLDIVVLFFLDDTVDVVVSSVDLVPVDFVTGGVIAVDD
jgi:hypothetical protein